MHLSSYWNSIWNWGRRIFSAAIASLSYWHDTNIGRRTRNPCRCCVSGTHSGDGTNRCQQLTHNTLEPPDRSCDRCLVQNTFSAVKTQQSHYLHVMESTVGFFSSSLLSFLTQVLLAPHTGWSFVFFSLCPKQNMGPRNCWQNKVCYICSNYIRWLWCYLKTDVFS